MNYVEALTALSRYGPSASITSREWSDEIMSGLRNSPDYGNLVLHKRFSTKRLSGDLDRLYRMGLISRKRIKRIIHSRNSRPVMRGFAYRYSISKQGWQYLEHLSRGGKTHSEPIQDAADLLARDAAIDTYRRLPEALADEPAKILIKKQFTDRGRHLRFPTGKYRDLFEELELCHVKLAAKDKEIERLRKALAQEVSRSTAPVHLIDEQRQKKF
jgi:hypothetical protein